MAKCPKCSHHVGYVVTSDVIVKGGIGAPDWRGIGYACPQCDSILSISIDPVALKTDTVNAVVSALRKGSKA